MYKTKFFAITLLGLTLTPFALAQEPRNVQNANSISDPQEYVTNLFSLRVQRDSNMDLALNAKRGIPYVRNQIQNTPITGLISLETVLALHGRISEFNGYAHQYLDQAAKLDERYQSELGKLNTECGRAQNRDSCRMISSLAQKKLSDWSYGDRESAVAVEKDINLQIPSTIAAGGR